MELIVVVWVIVRVASKNVCRGESVCGLVFMFCGVRVGGVKITTLPAWKRETFVRSFVRTPPILVAYLKACHKSKY